MSVSRMMALVLLALLPAVFARAWQDGAAFVATLALLVLFSMVLEALLLTLRGESVKRFLGDLSAPLCAVLMALLLPSGAPWWLPCAGVCMAIAIAKQAYGGLGENLFNPAMTGYAFVLLAFPREFGHPSAGAQWLYAVLFSAGGAFLLWRKIISWHAPVGFLSSVVLAWLVSNGTGILRLELAMSSVAPGTVALAAFFIVTDPVTGCLSWSGRLLFGAGAGMLLVMLALGAGVHSLPFAVLLMNFAAPWIDERTRPARRAAGAAS